MLRNYIKTAFRSLLKNRTYSILNIGGLAIGITCAAFIFLWVADEDSYDDNNVKKDRLFIVRENQQYDTQVFTHSSTPGLMGPAIKSEIPGVANTCRATEGRTSLLFAKGDRSFYAQGRYVEPSMFSMFTLPFVQGNAVAAFSQLHSLVITQSVAKKFFGDTKNIIGQTIRVDNTQDYVVSGVIKDLPTNSTLQVEWFMPFHTYFDSNPSLKNWTNQSVNTYVELKPGVDAAVVNKQLYKFIENHEKQNLSRTFLFGMEDWHLYDEFNNGVQTGGGRIQYVHLFTIVAWIILLIACINFMNLSTARSEKRAREVGVRKVLGAAKKLLIVQFIGEAIFMALIAGFFAVLIIALLLPAFNTLVQKQLVMGWDEPSHLAALLGIILICGIVAGSYPSLYLSSFNLANILKGAKMKDGSAAYIRKGLVVMQFTISIVLIISTIIVYQQIQHVKSRALGFNKNNLLEMAVQGDMGKNFNTIKQDLINTGYVENTALSDHSTITEGNNTSGFTWAGKPADSKVLISVRNVSAEFMATSGFKVLEGRNINAMDTIMPASAIITQSLEKLMGKGSALGKVIRHEGSTNLLTVVGVINDYVYGNMYGQSDPVVFLGIAPRFANTMYVRIKPEAETEKALAGIQNILKKDNPGYPFDYRFVDDRFNQIFQTEMLVSKLSRVFAALAIVISCLGLFGLAAYTAERRNKEIGIRKVLGASVSGLARLLSKDFLQLVIISCLVAFPLAYWIMQSWLTNYAYHIAIHWWVFAAAGVAAVIIALATISFQSIKAAVANPVKSLRSE